MLGSKEKLLGSLRVYRTANVVIQRASAFRIPTYTNIVMCVLIGDRKVRVNVTLEQTTSAIDEVGGQSHPPPAGLPPGKTWYTLYRRLGRPQGRSGRVWKISPHWDSIPGPSSPDRL